MSSQEQAKDHSVQRGDTLLGGHSVYVGTSLLVAIHFEQMQREER
jgi:hypothetical protein